MSFKSPPSADAASSSMTLQHWRDGRLVSELTVPKAVHGALVNDGYFSSGAAWASGEDKVAYTAEVRCVTCFRGLREGHNSQGRQVMTSTRSETTGKVYCCPSLTPSEV